MIIEFAICFIYDFALVSKDTYYDDAKIFTNGFEIQA
jgi:hypothetical protein